MVFGVAFHERTTTLHGSFQPNPESELTVDRDCYRLHCQSALHCNVLSTLRILYPCDTYHWIPVMLTVLLFIVVDTYTMSIYNTITYYIKS